MKELIKSILPTKLEKKIWHLRQRIKRVDRSKLREFPGDDVRTLNCMIGYNKYGGYCTPVSSQNRPAVQKILRGLVHEPDTIQFMIDHCGDGDVVHAGTFFGDFVPALSRHIAPQAQVWAFEPSPENHRCAEITVLLNQLSNVVLTHAGLGDKNEKVQILVRNEAGKAMGGESLILSESNQRQGGTEETRIVRIDDVVPAERHISIIQLDVEGYEIPALTGALETIKRCKPYIILEFPPKDQWMEENIYPLGYRPTGKLHLNTVYTHSS